MQHYSGPARPETEVAHILSNPFASILDSVFLQEVDGVALGIFADRTPVLPGVHTVKIMVSREYALIHFSEQATLTFEAVAGQTYRVGGRLSGGKAEVWLTHESTGLRIPGQQ